MTIHPRDTPKNAIYTYACDYDKWGFSDKNGNIKVPCKYEATYIVQRTVVLFVFIELPIFIDAIARSRSHHIKVHTRKH
ncbi:MAG: WG repeat-containing protein [Saprospiraceae bacterium]|nr:WG repeat-containing protein [Saprospiraceae bacterium]